MLHERDIFCQALEIDDSQQRSAYVDETCQGNAALRQRVYELLNAHSEDSSLLQERNLGLAQSDGHRLPEIGSRIGRYKLLEQIGEGGCGVVYMADQLEPIRRKVAFKLIKPGMDTKEVLARFEAERQALAMMDHQNIAMIHDAGATDLGHPYFVMELVNGVPITEFCNSAEMSLRMRLDLFTKVCHAVQHAHQKGIIHRDIKPTNILVTNIDGEPVPKVIDFGIAKAIDQELSEKTLFTHFGCLIGTPQYMSPEQAERSGIDIDTRADIYSLGVVLYELLTGTTPIQRDRFREASYAEFCSLLSEYKIPTPSARLSTISQSQTPVQVACGMSANRLPQMLRGDVDWIVMKCLDKDRKRRYSTANELADDIARYLSNEAVVARPPSAIYRFRKLVRRRRHLASLFAAVGLSLSIGMVIATKAFIDTQTAQRAAENQARRANEVAELAKRILLSVHADDGIGAQFTVRQMLDKFCDDLPTFLLEQPPEVERDIRSLVGLTYARLGLQHRARLHLQRAHELTISMFGAQSVEAAHSYIAMASNALACAEYAEAESSAESARRIFEKVGLTDPKQKAERIADEAQVSRGLVQMVIVGVRQYKHQEVANEVTKVLENRTIRPTSLLLHLLTHLYLDVGDFDRAAELCEAVVEPEGNPDAFADQDARDLANSLLALICGVKGDTKRAQSIYASLRRRTTGFIPSEDNPWQLMVRAWALFNSPNEDDRQLATKHARQYVEYLNRSATRQKFEGRGPVAPLLVAIAHYTLAECYVSTQDYANALPSFEAALRILPDYQLFIRQRIVEAAARCSARLEAAGGVEH